MLFSAIDAFLPQVPRRTLDIKNKGWKKSNSHIRPTPSKGLSPCWGQFTFQSQWSPPVGLVFLLSPALNFIKGSSVVSCGWAVHNTSCESSCRPLQLCDIDFFLRVQLEGKTHFPTPTPFQWSRGCVCFFLLLGMLFLYNWMCLVILIWAKTSPQAFCTT